MEIKITQEHTLDISGEVLPIDSYYCHIQDPILKYSYYMDINGCGGDGYYFFTYISKPHNKMAIKVDKTYLRIRKLKKEHIEVLIQMIDNKLKNDVIYDYEKCEVAI